MEYLLFLLAFIAGSLSTIMLDKIAARRAHVRRNKELRQRELLTLQLIAEGWQRPWGS